jgi:uncharacterized membrane protein YhfC
MNPLYITHPVNGILMIAIAIGFGIFLTRRFHMGWRLWFIGGATFIISQVFHLPFNLLVLRPLMENDIIPNLPEELILPMTAILFGLSAGLFEETARYATYRWWAKDARTWRKGIIMGAGHGGIEAIILGLLVLYTFAQMVVLLDVDLTTVIPADQIELAQLQIEAYWSAPWYATLLGAVERAFTIPFHIAASVMVLQVFKRGQIRWLWFAIGWHTTLNAISLYAASTWGPYIAEVIIGLTALINIGIIFALRTPDEEESEDEHLPLPGPISIDELPELETTPEKLDGTRFT